MRNSIFGNLFGFDYVWPYRSYYRRLPIARTSHDPALWEEKRLISTGVDGSDENYFNQLFQDFDRIFGTKNSIFGPSEFFGSIEQKRTDSELSITVTAPGVDPSEVSLTVETAGAIASILRLRFQESEKSWQVKPEVYDLERVSCTVKNGIITVTIPAVLPKIEEPTTRNIPVNL